MIFCCHMICSGWLVGFSCQFFPFCVCQCSVADGFHFFSVLLVFYHNCVLFLPVCVLLQLWHRILYTRLSEQLYICFQDGLEDFLVYCSVLRLCLYRIFKVLLVASDNPPTYGIQPTYDLWLYFGHMFIISVTWPYAWWSSPLRNETSQLGIDFVSGCVI